MNTKPRMIGANKRPNPGGFTNTRRPSSRLGFGYEAVKKAADDARLRLLNKAGLARS